MFVKLVAEWIHCGTPTENGLFNDRDEVYFIVAGGGDRGAVSRESTRISPPPPEDYFQFKEGVSLSNITLWEDFLPDESSVGLSYLMREQDNGQLTAIKNLASHLAAQWVAGTFSFLSTGKIDYANLTAAAAQLTTDLFESSQNDGDQTIGAFDVVIQNQGGKFKINWSGGQGAELKSPSDSELSAQFDLDHVGKYQIRLALQRSQLYRLVNSDSQKAIDVPNGSTSVGVQLQQYTPHDGRNQAWFMKQAEGVMVLPLDSQRPTVGANVYIFSDLSGLCLDLRGGRIADDTAVQQYSFHGDYNQRWGW